MGFRERMATAICDARVERDGLGHPRDGTCAALATAAVEALRSDLVELEMRRWFSRV